MLRYPQQGACLSCIDIYSGIKVMSYKIGGVGSWNFRTVSCKFPTVEIVGAQNFHFAPKFSAKCFFATNCAFLDEKLSTIFSSNSPTAKSEWGWALPPTPPCQNATGYRDALFTGGEATGRSKH